MCNTLHALLLCVACSVVNGELDKLLDVLHNSCSRKIKKTGLQTSRLQCLTANASTIGPNDKVTFEQRDCFCDARCYDYGDCCLDIPHSDDSDWSCRKVPHERFYVFMKQVCPKNWIDGGVRMLCEEEIEFLAANGQRYHHLQDIPVYSMSTKTLYRNVFCATCNQDTNLEKWNTEITCDRNKTSEGREFEGAVYIPEERKWQMSTAEGTVKCSLLIKELTNLSEIASRYNGRRCKGISTCSPSWTSEEDKRRCVENEGFLQFKYYDKEGSLLYKNPYCAKCNNISESSLRCTTIFVADTYFKAVWYPRLLDFNFDDSQDKCSGDQIYDPVLRSCLSLSCGRHYEKIGDQCVIKENQKDEVEKYSCRRVILDREFFVVLENEVIYVNHTGKLYSKEEYEAEVVNGTLVKALICADEVVSISFSPVQYWMSGIGLMISVCCLLIHLVVYLILPKLRNLPGKILMCLSASLLLAQASFMLGANGRNRGLFYCQVLAVITHFAHLAAFFWMNVMALDICRTFCSSRPRSEHSHSFLKYSLYAWILPAVIITISLVMDFAAYNSLYSPHYGRDVCLISQKRGILIFFAVPLALLLLSNLMMFVLTATSIRKTTHQTKMATKNSSEKVRFLLYVKIALILGLTWIFGFIASLTKLDYLWYPFIVFNSLQGAFIFLSFTVKRKVWKLLKERLGARKGMKKGKADYAKHHTSTSNLSTVQTSLSTSLSASVPVLCNQKDIVQAIMKGNFQNMKYS